VPIASVLAATGGWNLVFIVSAVITIAAGVSAKFILAPMRARWIASSNQTSHELEPELAAANGPGLRHWPEQTGE
jgi:MFS transporter, OFA family, oxalate/formate antiporter